LEIPGDFTAFATGCRHCETKKKKMNVGVNGEIIKLKKLDVRVWTALTWLRMGSSGGLL
jgi:hypothetical protein